jgi:hypothetical protein
MILNFKHEDTSRLYRIIGVYIHHEFEFATPKSQDSRINCSPKAYTISMILMKHIMMVVTSYTLLPSIE